MPHDRPVAQEIRPAQRGPREVGYLRPKIRNRKPAAQHSSHTPIELVSFRCAAHLPRPKGLRDEGRATYQTSEIPRIGEKPLDPWRIDRKECVCRVSLCRKKTKWDGLSPLPNFDAGDHEDRATPK